MVKVAEALVLGKLIYEVSKVLTSYPLTNAFPGAIAYKPISSLTCLPSPVSWPSAYIPSLPILSLRDSLISTPNGVTV